MPPSERVRQATTGRWRVILPALGIDASYLTGRKGPCPLCKDGRDRWRFDDLQGRGTWFCNQCDPPHAGDGFALVMRFLNLDFAAACREIEKHTSGPVPLPPRSPSSPGRTDAQKRRRALKVWNGASPIDLASQAGAYLLARCGLMTFPPSLRYAPSLALKDPETGRFSHHPGMLALVSDAEGALAGVHRTFLDRDGWTATVDKPKRLMGPLPLGSAVRLAPPEPHMGIAEGIETALSCQQMYGIATWAAVDANRMKHWAPPPECRAVTIFADNDANRVGQIAAEVLEQRLKARGLSVTIRLPEEPDTDFNDVHQGTLAGSVGAMARKG